MKKEVNDIEWLVEVRHPENCDDAAKTPWSLSTYVGSVTHASPTASPTSKSGHKKPRPSIMHARNSRDGRFDM